MNINIPLNINKSLILFVSEQIITQEVDNLFDSFENLEQVKTWLRNKSINLNLNNDDDHILNSKFESFENSYNIESFKLKIINDFLLEIDNKINLSDENFLNKIGEFFSNFLNNHFEDMIYNENNFDFLNAKLFLKNYIL